MKNRTLLKFVTNILHQLEISWKTKSNQARTILFSISLKERKGFNSNKSGPPKSIRYSRTALGQQKNWKATGIHNILSKSLKLSKDIIALSLTTIFNACIKERIFINDFKTRRVSPIFKSGRKDLPGNYRPVTVLPTIARIFERNV